MPSFLDKLPRPFFVLAPMDDVTDTVFRQIIATLPYPSHLDGVQERGPDLYFTEFVNVDGLQSPGRPKLLNKLQFTDKEKPLVAQLWGKNPENYYKTVKELKKMGFSGVDINMGCPDKAVIKNGCCIALADNRELAGEIIDAVKRAAGDDFPVSVKTRLGNKEVDLSWIEFLLNKKLNMLTIHGRTAKQMSKVPADWDLIGEVVKIRNKISPTTLIVGNGDVLTKQQGKELAEKHGLDGIMIGRGVFHDPFVFSTKSPWANYTRQQKIDLYTKHVKLFQQTHGGNVDTDLSEVSSLDGVQGDNEKRTNRIDNTESESRKPATQQSAMSTSRVTSSANQQAGATRSIRTLGKFCKIYINDFPGAKELREKLMSAKSIDELLSLLNS